MNLEKAYERANKEAQWQVMRMYDVGGKLLNDIRNLCVKRVNFLKAKVGGREFYKINNGGR